jgi:hypothetical protein
MKIYLKKKLADPTDGAPCLKCYFFDKGAKCEEEKYNSKLNCISETLDFYYVQVKYKEKNV